MFKYNHIIASLLILCTFLMAEPLSAQKKGKKNDKKGPSQEQIVEAQDYFIAGNKEKILGDNAKAIEFFVKSLDLDPDNHAAAFELARIYKDRDEFRKATDFAMQAANADESNQWYQFLYAELIAEQGDFDEAAKIYEKLIRQSPGNPEYYFDLAFMLANSGSFKEAIKAMDNAETIIGVSEDISMRKREMYLELEDIDGAIREVEKLSEAYPNEVRYQQMLADAYTQIGKPEKANEVYRKLAEKDPNNPFARLAMADHYRSKGENEKAMTELKAAFGNAELPAEPKIQFLIATLQSSSMSDQMLKENTELAEILAETHPNDAQTHLILGHLQMDTDQPEKALDSYRSSLNIDGNQLEIWNQVFVLEASNRMFDDLAKDSQSAIEVFPNQSLVYYFNGMAHSNLQNYDKATKSFKRAANIGTDSPETLADIYAQLGDLYNTKGEYDRSDEYFQKSIEAFPNNPYTLNNFSYYLSLREDKLEEAAKMSLQSNELEPNNPSFQDTYAWILYQMGNFEEAKQWQEKALASGGDKSGVVLDHYGDILYRLKDINGAVEAWKIAKSLGLDSDTIDRKIQDRKIY